MRREGKTIIGPTMTALKAIAESTCYLYLERSYGKRTLVGVANVV